MTEIVLHRFCQGEMGTFGKMVVGDKTLYTVERPWLNNEPRKSCVPRGTYTVTRHDSPKFGDCWILEGITVGHFTGIRTHILIHAANKASELQDWAVLRSRDAMKHLDTLPDEWTLVITGVQ
jgi:hypothetical protein